jgi:DNA topoisomerase IB
VVSALRRRRPPGQRLFAYAAPPGARRGWRELDSADMNRYLRDLFGLEVTAKDFRTWHATVLAAVGLAVSSDAARSPSARKRAVSRVIREVADYLGNTAAVCRGSYVDTRVIDRYLDGETARHALGRLGAGVPDGWPATQGDFEAAVIRLLRD